MYHQYMYGSFSPVAQPSKTVEKQQGQSSQPGKPFALTDFSAFKKLFSKFDTGDILLVLIILFLFFEGDNLELVITLGLMLLFGLEDPQSAP